MCIIHVCVYDTSAWLAITTRREEILLISLVTFSDGVIYFMYKYKYINTYIYIYIYIYINMAQWDN